MKAEITTRQTIGNSGRHPAAIIKWKYDDSWAAGGYTGEMSVWTDGKNDEPKRHTVTIGQGSPIGHVSMMFDPCNGGAWSSATFNGTGLSERDLQWATIWAVECLKNWKRQMKGVKE